MDIAVNPTTYVSKRKPRAKQVEALAAIEGRRVFALRMWMRTGKTKVIVDDWGRMALAGGCLDLFVVAPGGAYLPWRQAILDDLPDELAKRTRILVWQSYRASTKSFRREATAFMNYDGPRALIMNVEALSMVKAARDLAINFGSQRQLRNMVVVDESVVIKNPDSLVGRFAAGALAPLFHYRRIMTGLISPRSPLDLYNQFRFLDPTILGYDSFVTFRSRYAKVKQVCMLPNRVIKSRLYQRLGLGGHLTGSELRLRCKTINPDLNVSDMTPLALREYLTTMHEVLPRDRSIEVIQALGGYIQTVPVVDEYQNVQELHDRVAPHSFRCRLEDCYDMPASDYSFWDVPMADDQRRLYDEVRQNACAQLASLDHVTATHVVVQMLRLHQILLGHVVDEEGKTHDVPERRTKELLQLLETYDGKAVIWCSYDYNIRRVAEAIEGEYGSGSVARFWGGNVRTREQEETRFKTDPACRFQVATPDAGKYGRDWAVANLVVFYSSRNNLDHRQQAEDRVKAVDKTSPVAYVDMRVANTVEDKIIRCLRDKIDLSMIIDGDKFREWLV